MYESMLCACAWMWKIVSLCAPCVSAQIVHTHTHSLRARVHSLYKAGAWFVKFFQAHVFIVSVEQERESQRARVLCWCKIWWARRLDFNWKCWSTKWKQASIGCYTYCLLHDILRYATMLWHTCSSTFIHDVNTHGNCLKVDIYCTFGLLLHSCHMLHGAYNNFIHLTAICSAYNDILKIYPITYFIFVIRMKSLQTSWLYITKLKLMKRSSCANLVFPTQLLSYFYFYFFFCSLMFAQLAIMRQLDSLPTHRDKWFSR